VLPRLSEMLHPVSLFHQEVFRLVYLAKEKISETSSPIFCCSPFNTRHMQHTDAALISKIFLDILLHHKHACQKNKLSSTTAILYCDLN